MNTSRYLFRGLTPQGNWVYGDLIQDGATPEIGGIDEKSEPHFRPYERVEVHPETVGQWTGLYYKDVIREEATPKDMVFEGDRVRFHYFYWGNGVECEAEIEGIIVYKPDYAAFCLKYQDGGDDFVVSLVSFPSHEESFEYLGNIHENPALCSS